MRRKKFLSVLVALLCLSCAEDQPIAKRYKTTVINNMGEAYDVYWKQDFTGSTFAIAGTLEDSQSLVLPNLLSGVTYYVRIIEPTLAVENFKEEKAFSSNGEDVVVTFE